MTAAKRIRVADYDVASICDRITNGETQSEIAKSLDISAGMLSVILSRDDDTIKLAARARLQSAETWTDKGLEILHMALRKDSEIDAGAARAYDQSCRNRAAVRNPMFRDKIDATLANADNGSFKIEQIRQIIVKPDA